MSVMYSMFNGCSSLTTIYAGEGWSTDKVPSINTTLVFKDCTSLVGGMGTTYDADHIDAEYAHLDGGPENPGYFSEKVENEIGDVSGDGIVSVADATSLIDYLLGVADPDSLDLSVADCNNDSNVSIADVTSMIDYILNGVW